MFLLARRWLGRSAVVVLGLVLGACPPRGAADEGDRLINDCGVNSLYLLLRLCSAEVDLAEVRRALPDTRNHGLSMAEIGAASGRYGVSLRGERIEPGDVPIDRPMIVLLKSGEEGQGHFVVLEPVGVLGKKVMVLDFPRPARIVDYTDLMKGGDWTGLALAPVTPWERFGPWLASGVGVLLVTLGVVSPWRRRRASSRRGRAPAIDMDQGLAF